MYRLILAIVLFLHAFNVAKAQDDIIGGGIIRVEQTFHGWTHCFSDEPEWISTKVSVGGKEFNIEEKDGSSDIILEGIVEKDNCYYYEEKPLKFLINLDAGELENSKVGDWIIEKEIGAFGVILSEKKHVEERCKLSHEGFDATLKVIFDNPVVIKASETNVTIGKPLELSYNKFYLDPKLGSVQLQYQINNEKWQDLNKKIDSTKPTYIYYEDIVGKYSDANADYFKNVGKKINFRAKKTLLNGKNESLSNTEVVRFFLEGPSFKVNEIRNSSCHELSIQVSMDSDSEHFYSKLCASSNYKWVLYEIGDDNNKGQTYDVDMEGENGVYKLNVKTKTEDDEKSFSELISREDKSTSLRLELQITDEDNKPIGGVKFINQDFIIPPKVKEIEIRHAENTNNIIEDASDPYLCLDITDIDESMPQKRRFPYKFYVDDEEIYSIETMFETPQETDFNREHGNFSFEILKENFVKDHFHDWYINNSGTKYCSVIKDNTVNIKKEYDKAWEPTPAVAGYSNVYVLAKTISDGANKKTVLYKVDIDKNLYDKIVVRGELSELTKHGECTINDGKHIKITDNGELQSDDFDMSPYNIIQDEYNYLAKGNSYMLFKDQNNNTYTLEINGPKFDFQKFSLDANKIGYESYSAFIYDKDLIAFKDKKTNKSKVWYKGIFYEIFDNANIYSVTKNNVGISYLLSDGTQVYDDLKAYPECELYKFFNQDKVVGLSKNEFDKAWEEFDSKRNSEWLMYKAKKSSFMVHNIPQKDILKKTSSCESGVCAYSGKIKLVDCDNCPSEELEYILKYYDLDFSMDVVEYPTSPTAKDGVVKLTYKKGGANPYTYGNKQFCSNCSQLVIEGLGYGNNEIYFKDNNGLEIKKTLSIKMPIKCVVINQTCSGIGGEIQVEKTGESFKNPSSVILRKGFKEIQCNTHWDQNGICVFSNQDVGNDYSIWATYEDDTEKVVSEILITDKIEIEDKSYSVSVELQDASIIGGCGRAEIIFNNIANEKTKDVFFDGLPSGEWKGTTYSVESIGNGTHIWSAYTTENKAKCTIINETSTIKAPTIELKKCSIKQIQDGNDKGRIEFDIEAESNNLITEYSFYLNDKPYGESVKAKHVYNNSDKFELKLSYKTLSGKNVEDIVLACIVPNNVDIDACADIENASRCYGTDGKILILKNDSGDYDYCFGQNLEDVINDEYFESLGNKSVLDVKGEVCSITFRKKEEIDLPDGVNGSLFLYRVKTTKEIKIDSPSHISFDEVGRSDVTCYGANDGKAWPINVSGNKGDYKYSFYTDENVIYESGNLAPGWYTMRVSDGDCPLNYEDKTVYIETPEKPLTYNVETIDPTCKKGSGAIIVIPSGGWGEYDSHSYSVQLNGEICKEEKNNAFEFKEKDAGTYDITICDEFCSVSFKSTLKQYINPSVSKASTDPVSCYGLDDGKIKDIKIETNGMLNGNDVYAKTLYYSFEPKNSNFYDAKEEIGLEGTISEIDNLAAGTYNLRVVDNNDCVTETGSELTIYVHQPYPLDVMVKEDKIEITERDGNDGAISVQVSGGNIGLDEITLTTEDGDEQRVLTSNTNVLQPVKGLKAGKYVVTVKDKKGCKMPEEKEPVVVELKQPDSKLSADVSSTDGLCAAMIGSITVHPTGGWGDYMITVSGEGVERVANENSEDAVFDGLKAGTYQVDVVDRNGARRRYEQVVESPEPISHKLIKSPVTCDDNGSVKIEITGGRGSYKSQMEGDEIVHDGDDVVYSDLKSHKEYVLLTTDENECEAKLTFTLDDDAMEIDIDDEYFQNEKEGKYGVKMHASVNGGVAPYTYSWSQIGNVPSEVFSTDAEAVIYRSGIYELTVKDALCTKSVVHDVAIGYDQKMIVEELHNQTSTTANGRVVLISDQTDFTSLTVFCGTEKMDIGDLQWSDKRLTIDNLSGGSYSVEGVLQDGTRRMATFYIEPYIEMQKEYVHVKNVSRAGADDGSIEVKFWGGIAPYGVSISNKADDYHDSVDTEENHVKFDNLSPAEYLITVTDGGNNIFGFETIYVNAPEIPLTLTCVENSPTKCYGDSNAEIKLKATGGWSHYRYADSKDMEYVGNMVFGGLPASNRRFYVIDEYGVKDSVDVIVTQPDELRATIASIDSLRCYMDPDGGAITFDITGGNGDYRIKYLSEDRDMHLGNKLEGLPSDDYKVTFTDRNQCTSPDMIEFHIPQPDMLEIANLDIVNTTCELDNGKIDIEMKGGSLPYRYDWKENGKSYTNNKNIGLTHTKAEGLLQRGLYAIEISDSHECRTKTDDIRIVESHNPRIAQDGVHTTDALCNGSSDGIAYVDSSDVIMGFPASPFKLTWPQGQDNVMGVSTLPAGQYEVIISDENNCSTSSQFTIGEPAAIVNRLVGLRNAWCYGYSDGRIETATTGGIGDYKYLWNTGEETTYLDSIKAGVYTVVVTDEHECTDTAKYEVGEPEKLIVDLGDDVLICPGNVYVFDGGEYTTYSWTKAETGDEKESGRYFATGEEGVYALQVTNDIGCFARDTVRLSIGNDALIANFLMASDAAVNDTILLVELSNMPVDSIRWEYDVDSFKSLTFDDDESYQFNLSAENTGRFYVTMWAYSGGCESFEQKYIDIFEACEDSSDFKIGYDPLIKSAKISPNPNDGEFDLMIKLREESDVDVTIHDVHDGKQIEHVVLNGMDTYNTRLNIRQWGSGIFVLKITAGNEGRVIKVLTTR